MSEELTEEELNEKIITICGELEEIGEKALSKKLFNKITKKIQVVDYEEDFINTQICATFPQFDPKCYLMCCTPSKYCPFRYATLRHLHLTEKDYREWKKGLAKSVDDLLKKSK